MSLEQLRKQAKDLLRAARSGDVAALERLGMREPKLAHAQHRIAHENGFASWPQLVHHLRPVSAPTGLTPLIRPLELRTGLSHTLADGTIVTTDDVFGMFVAARASGRESHS